MKHQISNWIVILLAFNLLNACAAAPIPVADGQVLALAEGTTVSGIYSVLNGAQPLGEVWIKGGNSVVAWPQSGGWAWACLKFSCQDWLGRFRWVSGGNGNIANWRTWSDLAAFLRSDGWTRIPQNALPTALTAGESISGFIGQMSGVITGFLVIPVMPVPTEVRG